MAMLAIMVFFYLMIDSTTVLDCNGTLVYNFVKKDGLILNEDTRVIYVLEECKTLQ